MAMADELSEFLNDKDFVCTTGWINRFNPLKTEFLLNKI
jgi:hypothetical protein